MKIHNYFSNQHYYVQYQDFISRMHSKRCLRPEMQPQQRRIEEFIVTSATLSWTKKADSPDRVYVPAFNPSVRAHGLRGRSTVRLVLLVHPRLGPPAPLVAFASTMRGELCSPRRMQRYRCSDTRHRRRCLSPSCPRQQRPLILLDPQASKVTDGIWDLYLVFSVALLSRQVVL